MQINRMHFIFINTANTAGIASTVYIVGNVSAVIGSGTVAGPTAATNIACIASTYSRGATATAFIIHWEVTHGGRGATLT